MNSYVERVGQLRSTTLLEQVDELNASLETLAVRGDAEALGAGFGLNNRAPDVWVTQRDNDVPKVRDMSYYEKDGFTKSKDGLWKPGRALGGLAVMGDLGCGYVFAVGRGGVDDVKQPGYRIHTAGLLELSWSLGLRHTWGEQKVGSAATALAGIVSRRKM